MGFANKTELLPPEMAAKPCVTEAAPICLVQENTKVKDAFVMWDKNRKMIENVRAGISKIGERAAKTEQELKAEQALEAAQMEEVQNVQKLLASIIFCEAGNQPYEGQVAVGAVVMNRVKSGSFPDTIEEVIYQRGQFAPAGTGWLNRIRNSNGYTDSAMQAAADALNGANPVGNCLYFDRGGSGMRIGDHYFH